MKLPVTGLLLGCLLCTPAYSQTPHTGQLEIYQRQHISFFYPQDYPLNARLAQNFKRYFPRFDYHLMSTHLNLGFSEFLKLTRQYQQDIAGHVASQNTPKNPKFGEKIISWEETQKIARSAFVFVPRWQFDSIEIEGPFLESDDRWYLSATSEVSLHMPLYDLETYPAQVYQNIHRSWKVEREKVYRISREDMEEAASRLTDPPDLDKSLDSSDREDLLEKLRQNFTIDRDLNRIASYNPYTYMMDTAVSQVGYSGVIEEIRHMDKFLIKALVQTPHMETDKTEVVFGRGETPKKLGLSIDDAYKVYEYRQTPKGIERHEIGYGKMRQLNPKNAILQPIIAERDFEEGDQLIEYPKLNLGVAFKGHGSLFGAGAKLSLQPSLGGLFGGSEWYGLGQFGVHGEADKALFYGELGAMKQWFQRQWIWSAAALGGLAVDGSGSEFATELLQLKVQGGLAYQFTPDFSLGADLGLKYVFNLTPPSDSEPQVTGLSPFLEVFIRFDL